MVLQLAHPARLDLWLAQLNQVVVLTQPLTAAKIRAAPPWTLLFEHAIDTAFAQGTQQEVGGVIGISQ